jgi:hypothetical protein
MDRSAPFTSDDEDQRQHDHRDDTLPRMSYKYGVRQLLRCFATLPARHRSSEN